MKSIITVIVFCCAFCPSLQAQTFTLEESIQLALKNNLMVRAGEYNVSQFRQLQKTHTELGKFNANWIHGKYNSVNTDNNLTFTQTIPFPTLLGRQIKLGKEQTQGAMLELSITRHELIYQIRSAYLYLAYLKSYHELLLSQDSLFNSFVKAASLRYQTGESNLLEKVTAETQLQEVQNQLHQNESDILIYRTQLQSLLNTSGLPDISEPLRKFSLVDTASISKNPLLLVSKQQVRINQQIKKVEQQRFLPDITVGYFSQTLIGWQRIGNDEVFFGRNKKFNGFQIGFAFPLWFLPQAGRSRAAYFAEVASQTKYEHQQLILKSQLQQAQQEHDKNKLTLAFYESTALKNASLLLSQAQKAFTSGEVGYVEYLQALRQSQIIRANYLNALNQYNQSVIRIQYITGEN